MLVKAVKWMNFLAHIEDKNMLKLSHELDITYAHLSKIKDEFVKKEWIIIYKKGRENVFKLTKKGKTIQEYVIKILVELDDYKYKFYRR